VSEKARLRAQARERLVALSARDQAALGARIEHRVWSVPAMQTARSVLLYASLPGEVPTDDIAAQARAQGIDVVYPRCLIGSREMALHRVDSPAGLQTRGRFGIREPLPTLPEVRPGSIDVALIPGLAWDRTGHRLGRGAGYYDRMLGMAEWRGARIGLFFSVQELERIPFDPWDAPLDAVVTELEIISFA
jgi:5-formyltetrahydrofolate cyclo-ligase